MSSYALHFHYTMSGVDRLGDWRYQSMESNGGEVPLLCRVATGACLMFLFPLAVIESITRIVIGLLVGLVAFFASCLDYPVINPYYFIVGGVMGLAGAFVDIPYRLFLTTMFSSKFAGHDPNCFSKEAADLFIPGYWDNI